MPVDRSRIQILRLRINLKASEDYLVEVVVPCLAEHGELEGIDVVGVGDPMRVAGDWECGDITTTMMREMTG